MLCLANGNHCSCLYPSGVISTSFDVEAKGFMFRLWGCQGTSQKNVHWSNYANEVVCDWSFFPDLVRE